ncbi:MAG: N-acetylmuramoyl-L-alanine amidase [Elusimicrobia bacterium]|nr:N-acetylmuramoyl-L-alanine amidase [Elusimicrobiota bacterium]
MTPRPDSTWHPSPNYSARPDAITAVVVHATETDNVESPLAWLCDPASKASAHWLISKTGVIFHLVHESLRAWHAGVSIWRGVEDVNRFSVGIELVNLNDGEDPYPDDQIAALLSLLRPMQLDYRIGAADIIGHADVALPVGRKTDPGSAFPWEAVRGSLTP